MTTADGATILARLPVMLRIAMTCARVSCIFAALSCGIGIPVRAQTNSIMLPTYRGWGIGIGLDSANKLTVRDTGSGLICVGEDSREMFCQSAPHPGTEADSHISLSANFSPVPRRLERFTLFRYLERPVRPDSIYALFAHAWGNLLFRRDSARIDSLIKKTGQTLPQIPAMWRFPEEVVMVSVQDFAGLHIVVISMTSAGFTARELERRLREGPQKSQRVIVH